MATPENLQNTSDYRSSASENPQSSQHKTYSNALNQVKFPNKDQAIIFSSLDGCSIQDYLIPLGAVIPPKNIIYLSKMTNNRICVYLANKDIVETFINEIGEITVNGIVLKARKLISPAERIILSNVCPSISHETIINELIRLGLKPISPMTSLKISTTLPEFSHILSFRRQVFISPHSTEIPESFVLNLDNTSYRIFMTKDGMTCFRCKKTGHLASRCPEQANTSIDSISTGAPIPTTSANNDNTEYLPSTSQFELFSSKDSTHPMEIVHSQETIDPEKNANTSSCKRQLSEESTSQSDSALNNSKTDMSPKFVKPSSKQFINSKKKIKNTAPDPTKNSNLSMLEPAKSYIDENSEKLPLNFEELSDLLDNIVGSHNPVPIIQDYTNDLESLIDMLTNIRPLLKERSIKVRITKLRNKILKKLGIDTTGTESDSSSQDC